MSMDGNEDKNLGLDLFLHVMTFEEKDCDIRIRLSKSE